MGITGSIIETGVDKLVMMINSKGRVASADAALALGVSSTVVMEWADFLEEEGIISIEYKFAKPFLVSRKLTKKDVQERAKEFSGKKDVFIRKAEVSLSFLERESKKLQNLKQEFDSIKKDLGLDIDSIRNELEDLKKYEHLKIDLDKQIEGQKVSSIGKLQEITEQISRESRRYLTILTGIEHEQAVLRKDKDIARSIEESERLIESRLNNLNELIKRTETKAKAEEESIKVSESSIQKLLDMAEAAKTTIENKKGLIEPLVEESKKQTEKIKGLQDTIIRKITTKEKKLKGVKKASKKMRDFFKKKIGVLDLIERVNKDRNDLQNELITLIRKARSFQLSSKSSDAGKAMDDIEKKFKDVNNKKKIFEKELKKLSSFFK